MFARLGCWLTYLKSEDLENIEGEVLSASNCDRDSVLLSWINFLHTRGIASLHQRMRSISCHWEELERQVDDVHV